MVKYSISNKGLGLETEYSDWPRNYWDSGQVINDMKQIDHKKVVEVFSKNNFEFVRFIDGILHGDAIIAGPGRFKEYPSEETFVPISLFKPQPQYDLLKYVFPVYHKGNLVDRALNLSVGYRFMPRSSGPDENSHSIEWRLSFAREIVSDSVTGLLSKLQPTMDDFEKAFHEFNGMPVHERLAGK